MDALSVVVERAGVVEARHRVHAVAVRDGAIVDAAGDPELVTFMRSVAKPLQALPLFLDEPGLPSAELAIACASHEAREEQLARVRALLERAGATEDDLECGPEEGSRLRHNCSGKHAGMLVRVRVHGWPRAGYRLPDHPAQLSYRAIVAQAAGVAEPELRTGLDGCGVVAFALSLRSMAETFARLSRWDLPGAEAVTAAMRANPDLVGGPDASDSSLMRAIPGAIAKRGAEGLLCAGLPDGTGIALKVEDGTTRAVGPAAGRFLDVDALARAPVFNSRGERTGEVVAR